MEVTVTVKAWADEDESHYIPVVPILLLKGGDDADGRASEDDFATLEDYDFKRELTSPHEPYSVTIASSMLKVQFAPATESLLGSEKPSTSCR